MRDLPEEYWHNSYRRRAFRRVMDGTPTEKRGGAPVGIRRLRLEEPSKAVTGAARNEIYPSDGRSMSDHAGVRSLTNVSRRFQVLWDLLGTNAVDRKRRAAAPSF